MHGRKKVHDEPNEWERDLHDRCDHWSSIPDDDPPNWWKVLRDAIHHCAKYGLLGILAAGTLLLFGWMVYWNRDQARDLALITVVFFVVVILLHDRLKEHASKRKAIRESETDAEDGEQTRRAA